jgi:hypothetical protein
MDRKYDAPVICFILKIYLPDFMSFLTWILHLSDLRLSSTRY